MSEQHNIQKWEVSKVIKEYYLPYAMKVVVDRALPDIRDGLKPVARRILYKMYAMGATADKEEREKSITVVGEVLKIHGHGDASVYDALCKLTEQQEGQLYGYIDGEGAFGKQYSADKPSASRYTFCKLSEFSNEFFKDINKNTVKFIGEDKEHLQPLVLPVTFPNILVKQNEGIAVGMACYFPSWNLSEVCNATIAYIENENVDLTQYLKAPDFSTGGELIYDEKEIKNIINEGRGKLYLRSKYRFDKENNCIEVYEIPHNTTADSIISKIADMIKNNELREVTDIRDESGFNKKIGKEELKITIDIKDNVDIEKLMARLYKETNLSKVFNVNLNCLVNYKPKVMGIKEILKNWLEFRHECIINAIKFDLAKLEKDLHAMQGLEKVLLDIDKAIEIIRHSKRSEVIKKLCEEFKIDEIQANSIARMELWNINEEYILNKIKDIEKLKNIIENLKKKMNSKDEINKQIIQELKDISKKYGKPRKTEILYDVKEVAITEEIPNYNVQIVVTKDGYIKKIPLVSLRGSKEHRLKDGDKIVGEFTSTNTSEILVFTDKANCYKLKAYDLVDSKTSVLGEYLPTILKLEKDENIIKVVPTTDYSGYLLFAYEDGKISKITISSYQTKQNRTKLINAYSTHAPLINIIPIMNDIQLICKSSIDKVLIFDSGNINPKVTKNSMGIQVMKSKNDSIMVLCEPLSNVSGIANIGYYEGSAGAIGVYLRKSDKIIVEK